MLHGLWTILRAFWRFLTSLVTWLAVVIPDAIPSTLARMGIAEADMPPLDRETLLIVLSAALVLWIGWIDARPFVRNWLNKRRVPAFLVNFPNEINSEARYGANKRSTAYVPKSGELNPVTIINYYIDITNKSEKTLKNFHIIIHEICSVMSTFPELRLLTINQDSITDIAPGASMFFLVGVRHENGVGGESVALVDDDERRRIERMWNDAHSIIFRFSNGHAVPIHRNDNSYFILGAYADDVAPQKHLFAVNGKDPFEILHLGRINPDEDIPTRLRQGIAKETQRKSHPG